jgi:hypothetical protein
MNRAHGEDSLPQQNDDLSPLRHFVNLQHEHAVNAAVSSDSEDMQVILRIGRCYR